MSLKNKLNKNKNKYLQTLSKTGIVSKNGRSALPSIWKLMLHKTIYAHVGPRWGKALCAEEPGRRILELGCACIPRHVPAALENPVTRRRTGNTRTAFAPAARWGEGFVGFPWLSGHNKTKLTPSLRGWSTNRRRSGTEGCGMSFRTQAEVGE